MGSTGEEGMGNLGKVAKNCMKMTKSAFLGQSSGGDMAGGHSTTLPSVRGLTRWDMRKYPIKYPTLSLIRFPLVGGSPQCPPTRGRPDQRKRGVFIRVFTHVPTRQSSY